MVYIFFDKNSSGGTVTCADKYVINSVIMPNEQPLDSLSWTTQTLPEELHKAVIRKFEKRKVYSFF